MGRNRTNRTLAEELDRTREKFDTALTQLVKQWMDARDIRPVDLAAILGVSRPTVTRLLRGYELTTEGRRPLQWSLHNIFAVARHMKVSVPELVTAAYSTMNGEDPSLDMLLSGTEPRSRERLMAIIRGATFYDAAKAEEGYSWEQLLRPDEFAWECADFVHAYFSGELSDEEAHRLISGTALLECDSESAYTAIKKAYSDLEKSKLQNK